MTRYNHANITQPIWRNATSFFLIGPNCIGAKALETKWMHFFDANLQYFAKVLKKFNDYGVRSYANVYSSDGNFSALSFFTAETPTML